MQLSCTNIFNPTRIRRRTFIWDSGSTIGRFPNFTHLPLSYPRGREGTNLSSSFSYSQLIMSTEEYATAWHHCTVFPPLFLREKKSCHFSSIFFNLKSENPNDDRLLLRFVGRTMTYKHEDTQSTKRKGERKVVEHLHQKKIACDRQKNNLQSQIKYLSP